MCEGELPFRTIIMIIGLVSDIAIIFTPMLTDPCAGDTPGGQLGRLLRVLSVGGGPQLGPAQLLRAVRGRDRGGDAEEQRPAGHPRQNFGG